MMVTLDGIEIWAGEGGVLISLRETTRREKLTLPSALLLIGPELKPPGALMQGLLGSPCTAVWKLAKKWNSRTSPTSAVEVSGEKTKPPLPTSIVIVFATAVLAAAIKASALRAMDECIMLDFLLGESEALNDSNRVL
jgi:hypothetical protein